MKKLIIKEARERFFAYKDKRNNLRNSFFLCTFAQIVTDKNIPNHGKLYRIGTKIPPYHL